MFLRSIITITFLVNIMLVSATIYCAWDETENMAIGNLKTEVSFFHKIPESEYVIYSGFNYSLSRKLNKEMLIYDISTCRIKDIYIGEKDSWNPVILLDPNSGWNIYFSQYLDDNLSTIGKLHITNESTFGDLTFYDITSNIQFEITEVESKGEVWFAGDKIYRLNVQREEWSIFDYPTGWKTDLDPEEKLFLYKPFLTEDQKELFIFSYIKPVKRYQGTFIDLESGSFSPAVYVDFEEYQVLEDIKEWNGHENQYLVLFNQSLWVYDSTINSINLYMNDGFNTPSLLNMQSEDGKFLYLLTGTIADSLILYALNLEEKFMKTQSYTWDYWAFYNNYTVPYYDRINGRIIILVEKVGYNAPVLYKPGIIDTSDLSLNYIKDVNYPEMTNFMYDPNGQKFIAAGTDCQYIAIADFNGEISKSIPISFQADNWCSIFGSDSPTLIGNNKGEEFIRLLPFGRREFFKTDLSVQNICQYMDGKKAFVSEGNCYKEYLLENGSSENIQLTYDVDELYSDPSQNKIFGIGSNALQIIKQQGNVTSWKPSEENEELMIHAFDLGNSLVWLIYKNKETKEWSFYKISTITHVDKDSFTLSSDSFEGILNVAVDPAQRYLYLIDDVLSLQIRDVVIIDIINKNVSKRYKIQENVKSYAPITGEYTKAIPCLIPIQSKDRLFIYDHYNSFCINTSNLDLLYGNITDNPRYYYMLQFTLGVQPIQGYWDDTLELVTAVDLSYKLSDPLDMPRIFKIDIETGTILDSMPIPNYGRDNISEIFFPRIKDKIFLWNRTKSEIQTIYFNPPWDTPATITPTTNYIQFGEGDNAKFAINIKNEYDFSQDVTAYVWLYAPDGTMLFFDGINLTTNISGIPLTLPANLDITGDILAFTMPAGVPEGFYNFNAFFINENGDRGPVGTWNFYVKD